MKQIILKTFIGIIFVFLAFSLIHKSESVPFNSDEISWFFHTKFFEELFIKHRISTPLWSSHENFDHPQLSKYLFGAYLYIRDKNVFYQRDRLEQRYGRWSFYLDPTLSDIEKGAFALHIRHMRELNVIFTVGVFILIYGITLHIVRYKLLAVSIPLALLNNPLFINSMLRATSDAQMVFFSLLAAKIFISRDYVSTWFGPIIAGVGMGWAIATKLTGGIILFTAIPYEIFVSRKMPLRLRLFRLISMLLSVFLIWYITNPAVYRSPIRSTRDYVVFRLDESKQLQLYLPQVALTTLSSRMYATYCEFIDPACSRFHGLLTASGIINLGLLLVGGYDIFWMWKRSQSLTFLLGIFILGTIFGTTLVLPLYSDRYFILPLIDIYIIYAMGIRWIITLLFHSVLHSTLSA